MKTNNPIPLKYRFLKKYKGCKKQLKDWRRIELGDIAFTPDPNAPSWEVGFDNEVKYGVLKREHQNGSLSCTGQGTSKYVEMINLIENKKVVDLSARFIYAQIHLPNGCAYINDAMSIPVKQGCAEEALISSYNGGLPPDEKFMQNDTDITDSVRQSALKFQSKKYVWIDTKFPLTDADWENIRQVIWQFGGFVSGMNSHCMYASAYGIKNGKKFIKFINSYGPGSDIYYYGDVELYDVTFLKDLPNPPDKIYMLKIFGDKRNDRQYLVGKDGILRWIFDPAMLNDLVDAGIVDTTQIEWKDNLEGLVIGSPWAVLK